MRERCDRRKGAREKEIEIRVFNLVARESESISSILIFLSNCQIFNANTQHANPRVPLSFLLIS